MNAPHLTVEGVSARRLKTDKLLAGIAAPADVNTYKGDGHAHKPRAKRWDDRLTAESKFRMPAVIKSSAKHLKKPGMISLGGGLPSSDYFPIEEISMKVPTIPHFSEKETHTSGTVVTAGKHDMLEDKSIYDVAVALNYCQGNGAPQLLRWIVEHTEIVHNPKYADWSCTMSVGSTSAYDMVMRMFKHDNMCILSEEYGFVTAMEASSAMGIRTVGIKMDEEGLLASSMDHILTTWDPTAHNGSSKPFILYTVPSGQNPTGSTQSLARRRAIYEVAQKHDMLIIEDDPYYFLQMQPYTGQGQSDVPPPRSHEEFLSSIVPSLLSLDTDGRVIRFDSFSKVIAPGSRVGWVTAPEQIIQRYYRHSDTSTQGPSGFSQLALFKLLDDHWGHSGFMDWLVFIRLQYTNRRDVMLGACERHLPREVCTWKSPMAGMFHWLKIDWTKHPDAHRIDVGELEERIWLKSIEKGALVLRGSWFKAPETGRGNKMTDGSLNSQLSDQSGRLAAVSRALATAGPDGLAKSSQGASHGTSAAGLMRTGLDPSLGGLADLVEAPEQAEDTAEEEAMFFRCTFCAAPSDQMDEGIRRFGEALREEFGLLDGVLANGHV